MREHFENLLLMSTFLDEPTIVELIKEIQKQEN